MSVTASIGPQSAVRPTLGNLHVIHLFRIHRGLEFCVDDGSETRTIDITTEINFQLVVLTYIYDLRAGHT